MNSLIPSAWIRSTIFVLAAILAAGCGREQVQVYQVAKDESAVAPPMQQGMPAAHPEIGGAGAPQLTWKTPEGWQEAPPGPMRLASFNVTGKDGKQANASVVPLAGLAGGDLANVNRWRVEQLGLQPVSAEDLKSLAQSVEIAGQGADLYDVAGKNPGNGAPARILGVIQHRDGTAWFIKLTGDDELVAQQKPAFIAFLKSLKFEASAMAGLPAAHPPMDRATLPAGHPDMSPMPATGAALSSEGKPNWQPPEGWQEVPGGPFLVAKFVVPGGAGAPAAVNVSRSAGDGGGLAANVNRWRRQLGLNELPEPDVNPLATSVEIAGGKATFVDMNGTDAGTGQPVRLMGAMVPQSGQTWYYKLMGDAIVVEAQKDAFRKFVQTVKY